MRRSRAYAIFLAGVTALSYPMVGCGGSAEELLSVPAVDVDATPLGLTLVGPRLATQVIADQSPVIIDVRTPAEFAEGHIDGARLIDISSPTFVADIDALNRTSVYLVYCRSGNRSSVATAQMRELGFDAVYELDGGVIAWSNEGFELVG
ncbi:MAG: rhodanese-like domain-containing protein [Actinomycetota bacterium]|jgi:phage shock protein E|nr:rhodanese-like domain-containing protein [Actinomycetota bacterium]MDA3015717.1 rhodanese-like domain-containing protein [Actinomycetota bacterium]MDA3027953.1 rhodanese-like domain-containing protein [Actinomycetota bacterium]